jgi:adenine phosphoribosyltransferase
MDSELSYLHLIDTKTQGPRYDVTPLFVDPQAFARLIKDLSVRCRDLDFDLIAGIDALGFILGAAMALHMGRGFVPIRKGGKLPVATDKVNFTDYSGQEKTLELRLGVIRPNTPVLVVDEWIETGAQVRAAIALVERQGGIIAGVAGIHMDRNDATHRLCERYPCRVLSGWLTGYYLDR